MVIPHTGYLESGEARIYFETAGEGLPLLFIHAGVADHRQWNNEFESFASEFKVVRYDMRGFGRSEPVPGEFSHMRDLELIIDELIGDEPLTLIGCSMGGRLAMDYALEHPAAVSSLVLVGSGPSGLDLDVPSHPKEKEAERAYEQGDWDRLAEVEAQIWLDGMGRSPEQTDPAFRKLALEMNRLALSHEAKKLGERTPDVEIPAVERLDQLKQPTLIFIGEHDEPYSQAAALYMQEHIPDARLVEVPGAAHLANMERPLLFERHLRDFLQEAN